MVGMLQFMARIVPEQRMIACLSSADAEPDNNDLIHLPDWAQASAAAIPVWIPPSSNGYLNPLNTALYSRFILIRQHH